MTPPVITALALFTPHGVKRINRGRVEGNYSLGNFCPGRHYIRRINEYRLKGRPLGREYCMVSPKIATVRGSGSGIKKFPTKTAVNQKLRLWVVRGISHSPMYDRCQP